jgi:GNAT superfamily N-acetyltransferase
VTREIHVVRAEPDDVDQLSRLIAAAFLDLTASRFLVPDEHWRRRIYPEFFRLTYVGPGLTEGVVHCTSDRLAAAVWLPMGDTHSVPDHDYEAALQELTAGFYLNFVTFDKLLREAHEPYAGTPHDFLGVVGAHPAVWRQGNLRALMAERLPALDARGRGSYLEAAEPDLVDVYRKFGYERTDRVITLPGGRQMFPMWRDPRI